MSLDALMLRPGNRGLACPLGGFAIDPSAGVERAVITHAHSDHLHRGSGAYWCAAPSVPLLRRRLARSAEIVGIPYGEVFRLGEARVSFHPAGHILGSAQVRVEIDGEVWVVTGDFKREPDPTCAAFAPVRCDTLVTESTFGLPVFRWPDSARTAARIASWWERNAARGQVSHLHCYSLGKAQRVLAEVGRLAGRPIVLQGEAAEFALLYRELGIALPAFERLSPGTDLAGALVLGASLEGGRLPAAGVASAFASGWVQIPSMRRGEGFVLSDHADWEGLVRTVRESGARRVVVEHGYAETFARYLREHGIDAQPLDALPRLEADEELRIAGGGAAGRTRRRRDAAGMGDLFAGEGGGEPAVSGPTSSSSVAFAASTIPGPVDAPSAVAPAQPFLAAPRDPGAPEDAQESIEACDSTLGGIAAGGCASIASFAPLCGAARFARLQTVLERALAEGDEDAAVAAIAAHLAGLVDADAAWTVELLFRPPRRALLPRREVLPSVARATGLPDWLVEEAHDACGDAVETAVALLRAARGVAVGGHARRTGGPEERMPVGDDGRADASGAAARGGLPDQVVVTDPVGADGPDVGSDPAVRAESLAACIERGLLPLRTGQAAARGALAAALWRDACDEALPFLVRLACGRLRPPVARPLLERAIAARAAVGLLLVSRRLDGFAPSSAGYAALVGPASAEEEARLTQAVGRPPLAVARHLDVGGPVGRSAFSVGSFIPADPALPETMRAPWSARSGPWLVEWKWPGLRASLATGSEAELRSSSGEPLSDRFPSIVEAARALRPALLDGVLGVFEADRIADPTILDLSGPGREAAGVAFTAFDLLELEAEAWNTFPLERRRAALVGLGLPSGPIRLPPAAVVSDPAEIPRMRARATGVGAAGIVVKHAHSAYGDPAAWWTLPADPLRFRAVLAYLQGPSRGHPRGEWAVAVRRGAAWETIARVDPGLDDDDVSEIVFWARENTVERSGPVRVVPPQMVLEIECAAVDPSSRRRNGIALRSPRIVSWLRGAAPNDASTWDELMGCRSQE